MTGFSTVLLIIIIRLWLNALPRVERLHGFVFKASGSWQLAVGWSLDYRVQRIAGCLAVAGENAVAS